MIIWIICTWTHVYIIIYLHVVCIIMYVYTLFLVYSCISIEHWCHMLSHPESTALSLGFATWHRWCEVWQACDAANLASQNFLRFREISRVCTWELLSNCCLYLVTSPNWRKKAKTLQMARKGQMPAEIQVKIRLDKSDTEQNEQKAKEEEEQEASYRIGREAQIRQILTNEMFLWYLLDQNVKWTCIVTLWHVSEFSMVHSWHSSNLLTVNFSLSHASRTA